MGGLIGMDPDEIRALAGRIRAQAALITGVVSAVDGIMQQLGYQWRGPAADEFIGWWQQQHRPALIRVEQAVSGLAQSADNQAAQQDVASAPSESPNWAGAAGVMNAGTLSGVMAVLKSLGFGRQLSDGLPELPDLEDMPGILGLYFKGESIAGVITGGLVAFGAAGGAEGVKALGEGLDSAAHFGLSEAGLQVFSAAELGYDGSRTIVSLANHDYGEAFLDGVDVTKDAAFMLGPETGGMGYAVGAGIQLGEWGSQLIVAHDPALPIQLANAAEFVVHSDVSAARDVVSGATSWAEDAGHWMSGVF